MILLQKPFFGKSFYRGKCPLMEENRKLALEQETKDKCVNTRGEAGNFFKFLRSF